MSPRISIRLLAGQSDERLVALIGEGHERAFEALVHRYRRPLLRYCRRLRLSDARAEDVLQQAFLQAWLALARGAQVREPKPWLYRIVHNAAVNAMRAPLDGHAPLSEAPLARAALAGESELERRAALRDALADVAALPRLQQQAIFLTAVDGQTHDEVAGTLGISDGALRGLLYRARTSLRSAAAALTPPPLVAWAARGVGGAAGSPSTERLAELATGAGGAALTGVALKGAVVAVTAAVVAGGAAVVGHRHDVAAGRAAVPRAAPALGAPAASASTRPTSSAAVAAVQQHTKPAARRRDALAPRRAERRGRGDGADRRMFADGGGPRRDGSSEPRRTDGSDRSGRSSGSGDRSGSGTGGEDGAGVSGAPRPSTDAVSPDGSTVATATADGSSGDGHSGSGSSDGQTVAPQQPLAGEAQPDGSGVPGTSASSADG